MKESRIRFFERQFPSANMLLIQDQHPVIVDTGFGSDAEETEQLIRGAGISPEELHLVVNTHYHSDHVGGNFHLQNKFDVAIAAHEWDAELINARHPESCSAGWLNQTVEPYRVNRKLANLDEIDTGNLTLQVLHTPGHTLGHISLYVPEEKTLILGDLIHSNDVGWINIFREGLTSIRQSLESLDRLAKLPIQQTYFGHGPEMGDPSAAIDAARRRFEEWLVFPEKKSWHACKRIFAYNLIVNDGMAKGDVEPYLLGSGWFQDFARYSFQLRPEEFVPLLIAEMIRSGAASWQDDRLIVNTPHRVPQKEWVAKTIRPKDWAKLDVLA